MEQAQNGKAPRARLSSVANSIRLLTSFSGEENELGITTLASRLRLAKSTVHRLATTLTGSGFLEQNSETGKYRLGVAAPVQRMTKKDMQTCVPSVMATAAAVSARLGYTPSRSGALVE